MQYPERETLTPGFDVLAIVLILYLNSSSNGQMTQICKTIYFVIKNLRLILFHRSFLQYLLGWLKLNLALWLDQLRLA